MEDPEGRRLPIKLDATSNGEFVPVPLSGANREANRRAHEAAAANGSSGTDHGTAGAAFVAGGAVRGGRVIADWPGLGPSALYEGRDLRPTLDLRALFKAALVAQLGLSESALETQVFPDSRAARPLDGLFA